MVALSALVPGLDAELARLGYKDLYEAGVPLPYIRDILGHADLSTTEIYARASTEAKRKALEKAYPDIVTGGLPEWNQDPGLLDWLTSL